VVVEGPRAVQSAIDAGATVEAVFVEPDRHRELAADLARRGIDVRPVATGVLGAVLSSRSPQPVAAVVTRPDTAERAPGSGSGPLLVLAAVGDPGNVGTIVRSAVSAGAGPVLVGPETADPFGPKAIRASAGSVFQTTVAEVEDLEGAVGRLRDSGHPILGAAPRGGRPHHETDLTGSPVIVLGGETVGLPEALAVDDLVSIPQAGPAESLNVAMAATVLVFEAARQRRQAE
jgi:TrmH family RNA methyltransferase